MFTLFFILMPISVVVLIACGVWVNKEPYNGWAFTSTILSGIVAVLLVIGGGFSGMFGLTINHQTFTTQFTKALSEDGNHVVIIYNKNTYDITTHAVVRHYDTITNILISWEETPFVKNNGESISIITPDDHEEK